MAAESMTDYVDVSIETGAFPAERLRVRELSGREAISQLFRFDIEAVCLDAEGLDAGSMMGAEVTLVWKRDDLEIRRVHGMITDVDERLAAHADFRAYRIGVAPRAFRLTMIETEDIFLDMTVPEIIQHKLELVDLSADSEMRLSGEYPKREFVVQYNETDLAFISRLAEHVGISFFFDQRDGRDRIVFTDNAGGFGAVEGVEKVEFRGRGEERDVFALEAKRRLVPGVYVVRDYNYRTPQVDLTADHELPIGFPGGVIEHGGHFKTPEEGKALARVRAEERQANQLVYVGRSDLPGLTAGARTVLEGHPSMGPTDLLLIEVEHRASMVVANSGVAGKPSYESSFRATPGAQTYRPPRVTPRLRIGGLITGVIDAGPIQGAKTAYLDEQGRYLVRFLFDTTAPGERQASRPVRMLQHHVGENYGTHFPLKPGVEVLIGFVNGDPDRPVIVGAVPNPLKPTPVTNKNPGVHRLRTGSGITIDIADE